MQNYSTAKDLLEEAYTLYHQKKLRSTSTLCELFSGLGIVYAHLGNPEKAKHYHEQALSLAKETGSLLHQSSTFLDFAHTLIHFGDTTRAEQYLKQSITVLWAGNDRGRLLLTLIHWAKNELAKGYAEKAIALLGCVLEQVELSPKDQKSANEILDSVRKHLSQKDINTFLKNGRTLSLEQIINNFLNTPAKEDTSSLLIAIES